MNHKTLLTGLLFSVVIPFSNAQFIKHDLSWEARMTKTLITADTDGDGDLDIFGSDTYYGQHFTENTGENYFIETVGVSEGGSLTEHAALDLEGDGDLDFVSLSEPNGVVAIFENNGENEFTKTEIYDSESFPVKLLSVEDINLDGFPDISFRLSTSSIKWFENNGDGTFTLQSIFAGGTNFVNYCHFDADGDDDADVCILEASGIFLLCENLGGSYAAPVEISSDGVTSNSLYSFDEDADGDLDVLYTNPGLNEIRILRNLGDGTFASAEILFAFSQPVLSKPFDIDNDGNLDLIMYNQTPLRNYYWRKNLGGGVYAAPVLFKTINVAFATSFGDIDNDGDLDLLHAAHDGYSLVYYENDGEGVFSDIKFISRAVADPMDIAFSDMDLDGDLDVFTASRVDNKVTVAENLGYGNFSPLKVVAYSEFYSLRSIALADLNGDLLEDLIVASPTIGKTGWYENLGGGNFGPEQLISTSLPYPSEVAAADFDMDGDNDVLIIDNNLLGTSFFVFENEAGTLDPIGIEVAVYTWVNSLKIKDLDEDGNLDIVFVSFEDDEVLWLENTEDFTFSLHVLASGIDLVQDVSCADVDDDGDIDLLAVSEVMDEVFWIENLGAGTFSEKAAIPLGTDLPNYAWSVDLNNDDLSDLMITTEDASSGWYQNLGDMEFSERISMTEEDNLIVNTMPADLDQDGDIDFLTISTIDVSLSWMENMLLSNYAARGKIFVDDNENGVFDLAEEGINFASAFSSPESYYAFTSATGDYSIAFDASEMGDYTIAPSPLDYWDITTAPSYDITVDGVESVFENLDFGFYPSALVNRIDPSMTSVAARIDTEINLNLTYTNTGSTIPSGSLLLELAEEFTYVSSEITPELIDGQNISWSFSDLGYFESVAFDVTILVPGLESFGDTVISYFTVTVDSLGETVFTNMDSLEQVIQGPYDPNDKAVRPAGTGPLGYIAPETETLEYLIRFQNTGTDYAEDVVVKDQLDNNLDWLGLRPLSWSHPMEIQVDHYGEVSFIFEDIMLPDSNANELESHGFIKFEIDLIPGLPLETSIYNTANIYFDANPAIVTNTTVSTLHEEDVSEIIENETGLVTIYPNPFSDFTTVRFANGNQSVYSLVIYNLLGVVVYQQDNITGGQVQIRKADLGSGIYILNVVDTQSKEITDQVKIVVE